MPHALESSRYRPTRFLDDERGFTLVELLVSILILVAGLLGTVMLINAANATSLNNNLRETANNLSRELAEAANGLTYDSVTSTGLLPAIQGQPGLSDASTATGWQIVRHGITFTVTASACRVDDSSDSQGNHPSSSDPPYCAASTGNGDVNPDDYRRVTVDVSWTSKGTTRQIRQVVVVSKTRPSAFTPPQVRGVILAACTPSGGCNSQAMGAGQVSGCWASTCTMSATTCLGSNSNCAASVQFTVTTIGSPDSVKWSVDGEVKGTAFGSGNSWSFWWALNTSYPQTPVDGTYQISAQAYDAAGSPGGDPVGTTVTLNRFLPDITAYSTVAGRNPLFADYPEIEIYPVTSGARVDKDVVGYTTYRYHPAPGNKIAKGLLSNCEAILVTSCMDTAMPSGQSWIEYEVYPVDVAPDGNERDAGNGVQCLNTATEATCSRNVLSANTRPTAASNLSASGTGTVTLTWSVPSDNGGAGDSDSGDCVDTFRIYRTPTTQSLPTSGDRYDRTPFGVVSAACGTTASNSYVDANTGGVQHKYWVTSVDTRLAESTLLGPVTR
jgi:prepilin-type N-terminal cleavage/methylation domain-containing protein